ncbi:MAG: c-type cytochrome [Steroidobacteraceae bacterium]|nr:c-type cytochrome [Steroidobacteraceae bacterium]
MNGNRRAVNVARVALVVGAGCVVSACRSDIRPIEPAATRTFPESLVRRGAVLAAIGDCQQCHTVPGGSAFAGGLPLQTPFGTIYSTNITPDVETGIGDWSQQALIRAMREGVDQEGEHLYPAFPYDHFTLITDEDGEALYAYLMTREPVHAVAPRNDLRFPFNIRQGLAIWKRLYLRKGPYQPDTSQSDEWNRGAYLAQGLGHCGACHTPRNALGAEERQHEFAGGEAEGWTAYALDRTSPAPVSWNVESMLAYLRRGWHAEHGVASGPMQSVTSDLASVPESDLHAIATYVVSRMGEGPPEGKPSSNGGAGGASQMRQGANGEQPLGAAVYDGACASCHDGTRPLPFGGIELGLSTAVNAPDPRNLINLVLHGLPAEEAEARPIMPGFAGTMSDGQLTALLQYVRERFATGPAWRDLDKYIKEARDQAREKEVS